MAATHSPARTHAAVRVSLTVPMAVFVALHGIAHLVGTTSSLNQAKDGLIAPYLGGAWSISSPATLRVVAVAWGLVGVGVIAAAVQLALRPAAAGPYLAVALAASLVLSILGLWAAVVGVVINVVLLGLVWWGPRPLFGPARPGRS